jgi:integrase
MYASRAANGVWDQMDPAPTIIVRPSTSERKRKRHYEGIQPRHSRGCASRVGGACSCVPSYQAQVWSGRDRKTVRKTFRTATEARAWRQDALVSVRRGTMRAPTETTLRQAADDWLTAAEEGIIRTRSGHPYKPSAMRSYREALQTKLLPELGHLRLGSISANAVQDLVDQLVATGRAPSTVRNAILPMRAIYRRALARGEVALNPTLKLALPALRARTERVARPEEAEALLSALRSLSDRALWATALYAGLRRGELQALSWTDIDLEANLIHVRRSWDRKGGFIEPKSRSGKRRVPISKTLRTYLVAHKLHQQPAQELAFPNRRGTPFDPEVTSNRARAAWKTSGQEPIRLHECRHTYAAFMIAAGINTKALSTYMGHSTITTTLDRYGHLLPGNEHEAATLLDNWLGQACARTLDQPHRLCQEEGHPVDYPAEEVATVLGKTSLT